MTLSVYAIINGLTMLRAYGCIQEIRGYGDLCTSNSLFIYTNKAPTDLHADDVRRLESEGWTWDATNGRWEL